MKLTEPLDIMLDSSIPDKKRLMAELSKLSPGDTLLVRIDNSIASKAMVECFLKNKWCSVLKAVDQENASIIHIRLDGPGLIDT